MKHIALPNEHRDCPYCQKIQGLKYYKEFAENDAYYCDQCFRLTIFTGTELFNSKNEEIIAYPLATDKPVARDDRELLKKCLGLLVALDVADELIDERGWRCSAELIAEINDFYKEVEIYKDLSQAIIDNR